MERWLSLTVSKLVSPKSVVHISVPKRVVKQAVARNRIRRLLREALRLGTYFREEKVYTLKVLRFPKSADLNTAKKALESFRGQ